MMDQITSYIGSDISYALGWTIIHSIWQISLLALIMSSIHKLYQDRSSEFRYNVSLMSIVIASLSSVVTFFIYYSNTNSLEIFEAMTATPMSGSETVTYSKSVLQNINVVFTENLHHINTIWLVGIIIFSFKFLISYGYINYIKTTAKEILDPETNVLVNNMKTSIGINKAVQFLESAKINVPMVIGHVKPMILFPIGMINMLTIKEIEAIVAHELFHIKRHDYLVNMILTIVEIAYFFHPAMWWISANIKSERENCCDDAAINYNIDSVTYAKILVKLEEMKHAGIPSLAMPFASNKHQLLNRIKRILNMEQTKNDIREKSVATILLLFVAMLFASNTNSPIQEESLIDIETDEVWNNWDNSRHLTHQGSYDTINLVGQDEIVVEIDKGVFSSLTVDGEEIKSGEMVDKLKETFSVQKLNEAKKKDHKFYIKGNPRLAFENRSFMLYGDDSYIDFNGKKFPTELDTIPQKTTKENNTITIKTDKNGKKIEVTKQNGEITELRINGKQIPKSEYDNHEEDIDGALDGISINMNDNFEFENLFDGKNIDSLLSNSFGMIFDGENLREFEGNLERFFDNDLMEKLDGMENFRMLDLKELEDLDGLENLKGLDQLHNLEGLEGLEETLEKMGIQLDSTIRMYNFDIENFEGFDSLEDMERFDFFGDIESERGALFESGTVVDKIGNALNRDGLLEEYKNNKIELSGKHLKINGEKMPKALFNKYKGIYESETGAPLTKKSKMVFDITGTPSKRKVRTF